MARIVSWTLSFSRSRSDSDSSWSLMCLTDRRPAVVFARTLRSGEEHSVASRPGPQGAGVVRFGAWMFALAGIISITEWWVAFVRSSFYEVNGVYLFSDVRTWGWIQFVIGLIQLVACYAIFSVQPWGRWLGIAIAIVSVLAQLFFV